jgi:hypothetical protein
MSVPEATLGCWVIAAAGILAREGESRLMLRGGFGTVRSNLFVQGAGVPEFVGFGAACDQGAFVASSGAFVLAQVPTLGGWLAVWIEAVG